MACFDAPGDAQLSPDGTTLMLTSGLHRAKQRVVLTLSMIRGTYKYDRLKGFPWFSGLLDRGSQPVLEATIRKELREMPEVKVLQRLDFTVDRETRLLSVYFEILTSDGDVIDGSVPLPLVAVAS